MIAKNYTDEDGSRLLVTTYGDGEPAFTTLAPGEDPNAAEFDWLRGVVLSRKQVKRLRRQLKAELEVTR